MHTNYKVIQARDFIKIKPGGELNLEQTKNMLGQIAELICLLRGYELLLDVREAHEDLDQEDLCELVRELGRHRKSFRNKIAVVTRDDEQFNKSVFDDMCGSVDGFKVSFFTVLDDAVDWLRSPDDSLNSADSDQP